MQPRDVIRQRGRYRSEICRSSTGSSGFRSIGRLPSGTTPKAEGQAGTTAGRGRSARVTGHSRAPDARQPRSRANPTRPGRIGLLPRSRRPSPALPERPAARDRRTPDPLGRASPTTSRSPAPPPPAAPAISPPRGRGSCERAVQRCSAPLRWTCCLSAANSPSPTGSISTSSAGFSPAAAWDSAGVTMRPYRVQASPGGRSDAPTASETVVLESHCQRTARGGPSPYRAAPSDTTIEGAVRCIRSEA